MILITGATGLVGGETARSLASVGVPIRLLVRAPVDPGEIGCPDAQVVIGDLDHLQSLPAAIDGIEAVLLVSPATPEMVRQQGNLVSTLTNSARAHSRSAPRIVKLSGFMTALDSPSRSGRWHAEVEDRIRAASLPCTALRPPFFMQNLMRSAADVVKTGMLNAPLGEARIAMIDAQDIGRAAAACLVDDRHVGQNYLLTGPEALDFATIASELARCMGQSVRYQSISVAAARQQLEAAGAPPWRVEVLLEFYADFATASASPCRRRWLRSPGRRRRPLPNFSLTRPGRRSIDLK